MRINNATRTCWHNATRRIIACGTTALMVGTLISPVTAFAAEWVTVDSQTYEEAHAEETWSWDGEDDLNLNGYTGGNIEAAGTLNINYSGDNTTGSIRVEEGEDEDASLTVNGDAGSTLDVSGDYYGIVSDGGVSFTGEGEVSVSATNVGISSEGDMTVDQTTLNVDVDNTGLDDGESGYDDGVSGIEVYGELNIEDALVNVSAKTTDDQSAAGIRVFNGGEDEEGNTLNAALNIKDSFANVTAEGSDTNTFGLLALAEGGNAYVNVDHSMVNVKSSFAAVVAATANDDTTNYVSDIFLTDSELLVPEGGEIAYANSAFEDDDDTYLSVAYIGTGESEYLYENVASEALIAPTEDEEDDVDPSDTLPVEPASMVTPTNGGTSAIANTGDSTSTGFVAAALAGVAALATGFAVSRRRE